MFGFVVCSQTTKPNTLSPEENGKQQPKKKNPLRAIHRGFHLAHQVTNSITLIIPHVGCQIH